MKDLFIWILWSLGVIYVPEWDNVPSPYKQKTQPEEEPDLAPVPTGQVLTRAYGRSEPGKKQQLIQLKVKASSDVPEWNYERFDGLDDSYDFTAWSTFDDAAVSKLMVEHPLAGRQNYILVRPDVNQGLTNREIANKHNRKIRWAEEYAGAVRQANRLRAKDEAKKALSPTAPIDRGTAEGPQIPQGRGLAIENQ